MAIMQGAKVELISKNYTRRESAKTAVILHTADSKATGSGHYLYWNRDSRARASSHFYVDYDGTIHQLVDTTHIAWASGNANSFSIGIETQGWGSEPWTPQQVAALVRILVWAHRVHGVPLVEMTNSSQRRGIGYHRLGVAATRSQYAQGKSQTGGTLWSSAVGKVCPGAKREAQIPHIISLATGKPAAKPQNTTTHQEDDELDANEKKQLHEIWDTLTQGQAGVKYEGYLHKTIRELDARLKSVESHLTAQPKTDSDTALVNALLKVADAFKGKGE